MKKCLAICDKYNDVDFPFQTPLLTFSNSGACFFSFSIFHSFSHGLREDGGAVHEHLQSEPELTVSTV